MLTPGRMHFLLTAMLAATWAQAQNVNITPRAKPSKAPDAETAIDRKANIRVDTTLVLIPTSVTTEIGTFVTGLEKGNFRVYEDKVEQEIVQFSQEDAPLSVGIVFDTSASMGGKMQTARKAVAQFLKTANREDEFFLIEFSNRAELVLGFTPDPEEVQNKLLFTKSKGQTALLDGVYMAMSQMRKARNPRKVILIISDGGDNSSRYTQSEVKNAVLESDTQVYAIGVYESIGGRTTPEEFGGPELMKRLAEQTGGHSFAVSDLRELPDVAEKIGIELRNQYVLGYSPKNSVRDGKYRRVLVRTVNTVGLPKLKVVYRVGYYAPTQ